MRIARPSLRSGGFTLMEVLVTLALIAIVLPVAMHGVQLATQMAGTAKHEAEAAMLGQGKLAEIVASAQNSLSTGASAGDFGPDHPEYQWQVTTTAQDMNLQEIDLQVSWSSRGASRNITLSTWVYQSSPL